MWHVSDLIKILNNIFSVLWSSKSSYKVSKWFPYSITYLINNSIYSRFPHFILMTDCFESYRSVTASCSSADIGGRTLYSFSIFGQIRLRRWSNRFRDIRVYLKNVKRSFSLANKNALLYAQSRERSTFNGEIQNLRLVFVFAFYLLLCLCRKIKRTVASLCLILVAAMLISKKLIDFEIVIYSIRS